jgi:hypothetical protein
LLTFEKACCIAMILCVWGGGVKIKWVPLIYRNLLMYDGKFIQVQQ